MRALRMALFGTALLIPACGYLPDEAEAQAPSRQDCRAPEHRQFDFWLGTWEVTVDKAGKPVRAGTNRIESALAGCALIEHWESASGGHGTSVNFYDRRTGRWHQTWIDESGNALLLSGRLVDGRMVLASEATSAGAASRITWSVEPGGGVRQVWEKTDDGKSWTTAFDGRYTRKAT